MKTDKVECALTITKLFIEQNYRVCSRLSAILVSYEEYNSLSIKEKSSEKAA